MSRLLIEAGPKNRICTIKKIFCKFFRRLLKKSLICCDNKDPKYDDNIFLQKFIATLLFSRYMQMIHTNLISFAVILNSCWHGKFAEFQIEVPNEVCFGRPAIHPSFHHELPADPSLQRLHLMPTNFPQTNFAKRRIKFLS